MVIVERFVLSGFFLLFLLFFLYYKWMSHDPIFVTKNGTPSRHRYLGKAGSKAYLKAVEALSRRGRIEALERGMSTLSMGLEDLVEEASRFNKG